MWAGGWADTLRGTFPRAQPVIVRGHLIRRTAHSAELLIQSLTVFPYDLTRTRNLANWYSRCLAGESNQIAMNIVAQLRAINFSASCERQP